MNNALKRLLAVSLIYLVSFAIKAQTDTAKALKYTADFRFRIEQDWNSRNSNGTFRDDRTRFRYRFRAGVSYAKKWYELGFRIRTGNPNKQQDPQLTLGDRFKEFGTLPIGLEKLYFQANWHNLNLWVGKNTFPFTKSNELFWSDNVYPDGVFIGKSIPLNSTVIDTVILKGGHFIISTSNKSLSQDNYFQGYQVYYSLLNKRVEMFPSLYLFRNTPNIPDGNDSFALDYTIFHIGTRLKLLKKPLLSTEIDYYHNLQNYGKNDSIAADFKNQKTGLVLALKYGALKKPKDWLFTLTYARLQQFSIVDFMAQNDWARWDYSSFGSPDGRLSNLNGVELVAAYKVHEQINLVMKYYSVRQRVPYGIARETGDRIRLDLDVKF